MLQGFSFLEDIVIGEEKFAREACKEKNGALFQLFYLGTHEACEENNGALSQLFYLGTPQVSISATAFNTHLQRILDKFRNVFDEPKDPLHMHKIIKFH